MHRGDIDPLRAESGRRHGAALPARRQGGPATFVRSPDGSKYWIIATDLCWGCGSTVDGSTDNGSRNLVVRESTDLVTWSQPWLLNVAGATPDGRNAWAPEAIWAPETNAGARGAVGIEDGLRAASHAGAAHSRSPALRPDLISALLWRSGADWFHSSTRRPLKPNEAPLCGSPRCPPQSAPQTCGNLAKQP